MKMVDLNKSFTLVTPDFVEVTLHFLSVSENARRLTVPYVCMVGDDCPICKAADEADDVDAPSFVTHDGRNTGILTRKAYFTIVKQFEESCLFRMSSSVRDTFKRYSQTTSIVKLDRPNLVHQLLFVDIALRKELVRYSDAYILEAVSSLNPLRTASDAEQLIAAVLDRGQSPVPIKKHVPFHARKKRVSTFIANRAERRIAR